MIVTLPEKAKQIILKNSSYHILSLEITKLSRSYAGSYPSSFDVQEAAKKLNVLIELLNSIFIKLYSKAYKNTLTSNLHSK